jgi:hypothetical protein
MMDECAGGRELLTRLDRRRKRSGANRRMRRRRQAR